MTTQQHPTRRALDDDVNKFHLPPILAPEEPFYRKDLPGRHMRYFRNVTSQDREDRTGYYSSARHVAPSNTTGNFGHGPPIGAALDRFGARQQEQHQQRQHQKQQHQQRLLEEEREKEQQEPTRQDDHRLPSLYTALPEQRPAHVISHPYTPSDSGSSERSSPAHGVSPHHRQTYQQHSPLHSPTEKPLNYSRSHPSHQHHHQHQQQQQHQSHGYHPQHHLQLIAVKPKSIQPRSIAPAPMSSHGPSSPESQQSTLSPRAASKRPDRATYVKIEPKEQPYYPALQQHQQHQRPSSSATQVKRKWDRDHSPTRHGGRVKAHMPMSTAPPPVVASCTESGAMEAIDESSQELHLLSRRSQQARLMSATASEANSNTSNKKKSQVKTKMQRYQMTTIRCWHGAIAQKSYGIEKRYLCPPPMVHVSAGVNAKQIRAEQPHVTMSVIHEKVTGPLNENLMEQDCSLDDGLKCSFRNLHVTGTGSDSSKRFKLGLKVFLNNNNNNKQGGGSPTGGMPTAIMDSNPIPIISKPSKKTAKAGNASCFILNGMSVSLLNRINAQTVRTKYMAVDNNAVCAKIGSWSSFTIKMVKPPPPAPPMVRMNPPAGSMGVFRAPNHSTKFVPIRMKGDLTGQQQQQQGMAAPGGQDVSMARPMSNQNDHGAIAGASSGTVPGAGAMSSPTSSSFQFRHPQQLQQEPTYVFSNSEPVLYGSEIVLINDLTGIMTDRLIIRKVENGKVSRTGSGPVSQMQKVVLEHPDRVHPEDGRAYYLSASSIGSPKVEGKIPLQAAMDRSPLLEYRTSSKKASVMDMTPMDSHGENNEEDEEDELHEGDFDGQTNNMPRRVAKNQDSVAVDDFVCWTIAGIAKFDYTYFGPIPASVDTDVDPSKVPAVLACPRYNPQTNTMTMPVKNVFEKLTPDEESRLIKQQDDPYERKLTLSEYVYKRCEDTRQPMRDEEGPIQLWLAQHGPIRMRRRHLEEVVQDGAEQDMLLEAHHVDGNSQGLEESDVEESDDEVQGQADSGNKKVGGDQLPKIATKSKVNNNSNNHTAAQPSKQQPLVNAANGRYYGGSHLPPSMNPALKRRKLVKRPMGLEAELPYACEVRAAHDGQGNAKAELDILMVERASGVAYRTGYKVVYSKERERAEWNVEVVG
ncbi:hypothetical protein EDD11_002912 [Mortierella claussenii]|nr:hypothetical protein EDD11_002912 [Mortierella claussenii]